MHLSREPRSSGLSDIVLDLVAEMDKMFQMVDDLHDMRDYIRDMRLCFVALTISGYVGIFIYAIVMCVKSRRKGSKRKDLEKAHMRRAVAGNGGPTPREYGVMNGSLNRTPHKVPQYRNMDPHSDPDTWMTPALLAEFADSGGGYQFKYRNNSPQQQPQYPNGSVVQMQQQGGNTRVQFDSDDQRPPSKPSSLNESQAISANNNIQNKYDFTDVNTISKQHIPMGEPV